MKWLLCICVLMSTGTTVYAADDAGVIKTGKQVFHHVCAPCHGAGPGLDGSKMLPGTAALAAKYRGAVPALLEQRHNLTFEFLNHVVRHGQGAMPMFRKTEITDKELRAVAAYIMDKNN